MAGPAPPDYRPEVRDPWTRWQGASGCGLPHVPPPSTPLHPPRHRRRHSTSCACIWRPVDALARALQAQVPTFEPDGATPPSSPSSPVSSAASSRRWSRPARRRTPCSASKRNSPPPVLEQLAVVLGLRVFRHYWLGSGAPRPPGVLSDFTLRTDKQAVSWLRTERDINRFLAPWRGSGDRGVPLRRGARPGPPLPRRPVDPPTLSRAPGAGSGPAAAAAPPRATAAAAVAGPGPAGAAGSGSGPAAATGPPPDQDSGDVKAARQIRRTTGDVHPPKMMQPERHFLVPDFVAAS